MAVSAQVAQLIAAGVPEVAGISAAQLAEHAAELSDVPGAVLAVHPTLASRVGWPVCCAAGVGRGSWSRTIGSRKATASGVDARVPAIWISRGTGRDGPARRDAPKVGWCWAGNRHTWLGHASAAEVEAVG